MDLFLMIKDGRVEWKTFTKTPPLYLNRLRCHDPKVFQSIPKGVGYRIRLTNSNNETFREYVELYSRAMATSGYSYQKVKKELLEFLKFDPIELAKRDRQKKKTKPGCKVYFNAPFEPRVPHTRKIFPQTMNYLLKVKKQVPYFPEKI